MTSDSHLSSFRRAIQPNLGFIGMIVGGFAGALVVCSVVLGRWTAETNHRVQAVAALGPETLAVVAGSSHVFATLNPERSTMKTMNLAAPVCSYVCIEAIVRGNLPKLPGLKALIIELDVVPAYYDTLLAYHGDYRQFLELDPLISSMPIGAYQKYELWRDRTLERSFLGPLFRFGKLTPKEIIERVRDTRPVEDAVVGAGYANGPETMPPNDDGNARVARHVREARGLGELPRNEAALRRLIELGKARGLKLALMRFPHHPSYWQALPREWQAGLDGLLGRLQADYPGELPFWDFGTMPELSETDYRNGDHINDAATPRVTALFDERLAALLEQPSAVRSLPAHGRLSSAGQAAAELAP
jgi:hypothetical protein